MRMFRKLHPHCDMNIHKRQYIECLIQEKHSDHVITKKVLVMFINEDGVMENEHIESSN